MYSSFGVALADLGMKQRDGELEEERVVIAVLLKPLEPVACTDAARQTLSCYTVSHRLASYMV